MKKEEIKKRLGDNVLLIDKHELDSLKKITKTTKVSDYEVLTDDGFVDIEALHETIPYEVYHLKLSDGKELKCADNHIVFDKNFKEIFVKDLKNDDEILVESRDGELISEVVSEVTNLGYEEVMYDLELKEGSNRRYYTNGILSHNTEISKALADILFNNENAMIRIDMSEYQEGHSVSRLTGAPPGYIGYEEGGQLTEAVRRKPYSVVLFDEMEKAHPDVFNILLQVLDEGRLTDNKGRVVNFKNTIIILTSNLGSNIIQENSEKINETNKHEILSQTKKQVFELLKKVIRPEFLNRIDETIMFTPLTKEDVKKIVLIQIEGVKKQLLEKEIKFSITDTAVDWLSINGYDPQFGARPIKRIIQRQLLNELSKELLLGTVHANSEITMDIVNDISVFTILNKEIPSLLGL